jgi:hypothetical protein
LGRQFSMNGFATWVGHKSPYRSLSCPSPGTGASSGGAVVLKLGRTTAAPRIHPSGLGFSSIDC